MVAAWVDPADLIDPGSPYAEMAAEAASFVLFHLSGRKYSGVQTTSEIYCQTGIDQLGMNGSSVGLPVLPGPNGYQIWPVLENGVITNQVTGCCSSCGCTHLMRLRGVPVIEVLSVYLGNRLLDPDDYQIYDYSYLGAPGGCWNSCDDVVVTYRHGAPPPAMGKIAAKALADQYLLAMAGDDDCALPQRVTQISRQGVSWTLLDPQDFLDKGRTGIYQVDLFLTTVNPDGARMRARVFSPDTRHGKSVRGTGPIVNPHTTMTTQAVASSEAAVRVYTGRPLRWVVPGSFTEDTPPSLVVRPSGEEVATSALLWRSANYTLDLSSDEAERLLPLGSVLVVRSLSGETHHPVERRTA